MPYFMFRVKTQLQYLGLALLVILFMSQVQAVEPNQPIMSTDGQQVPLKEEPPGVQMSVEENQLTMSEIPAKPQVPVVNPQLILKDVGVFTQYDGKAPPIVPARKDSLTFYPCSQCHDYWQTISQPRKLYPVHDVGLNHGQQRFWCLTCHNPQNRDQLTTVQGVDVDFDDAWQVCGQCHSARQKDWYYGAHGKRVENWQGDAQRYNCTHCHNPHKPPFVKRKPQPKPPIRAGLTPMKHHDREFLPVWERQKVKAKQEH